VNEESLPTQSFNLAVGQDKVLVFTLDQTPTGNTSAWQMAFYLRSRSDALLLTKTSGAGITCTDGTAGVWTVTITDTDSDALKPGLPSWSFWRTDDGSESPLAVGTCEVYRTSRG
jgi:hypothetical protein